MSDALEGGKDLLMSTTQVAAQLFELQRLDLEQDHLRIEQQTLTTSLKGTRTLQKLRAECITLQQQLQASQQAHAEAEWALVDTNNRLRTQEQRLSEKKASEQEQQGLQAEIKRLKAQQSRQEETVLQAHDAEDFLREIVERKQSNLEQAEKIWQQENAIHIERYHQIEARLSELQEQRMLLAGTLNEEYVQRYNSMRKSKQGRAVSKVEQNSCQWCLAILTHSELQKVLASPVLQTCTNCGRILYYDS
jgi:predicted  nucleic acid-binding Zn-ribbon protein